MLLLPAFLLFIRICYMIDKVVFSLKIDRKSNVYV